MSTLKGKSPMHYLITGGAGFIGSHLADELITRGNAVTIIDDLSTGRMENIQHLVDHPKFNFAIDTILNEVVMDRLVSESDVIIHLAAAVGVRLIVEKPVHTIETNVKGTETVLKIARRYNVKVLLASTSEVYGKSNDIPFCEDDDVVLGPTTRSRWSYAATKMVDEFLGLAYFQEYHLPVIIFRMFNTVGPRQVGHYGMVIPRFIEQVMNGKPISVYSDGKMTRCFMHVYDTVQAILALAEEPLAVGKVFNIGSTDEITIHDLARTVLAVMDGSEYLGSSDDSRIQFIPYEKAYTVGFEDMRRRVPDVTTIMKLTGWEPKLKLRKILHDVISDLSNQTEKL